MAEPHSASALKSGLFQAFFCRAVLARGLRCSSAMSHALSLSPASAFTASHTKAAPVAPSRPCHLTVLEGGRSVKGQDFKAQLALLSQELYPRALRLTRAQDRAQDLVQDVVLRALQFETSFAADTNLKAWLHQILYSVFVTQFRRRKREVSALCQLRSDPCAWTQQEDTVPAAPLLPTLQHALDQLPPAFGKAVMLVDLNELSYKDAATLLGVPVGTVMSRLHRARRLLGEQLAQVAA
jgi:RNA polymerase sigma-70 factor (ECF subfamily)